MAEKERRYGDAVSAYRDVLRVDPGHWFAGAARARIEVLSLYDGSFAELAQLDAVRRDPARANDRSAVEELARLSMGWKGRVWADAQLFVAEAWVGRLKEPARGADPALAVARSAVDPVQRGAAWDLAYSALRGDLERASREIANDPGAPEPIRARVRREVRRHRLHRVSMTTVGGGIGLTMFALGVTLRRGRFAVLRRHLLQPIALAFLVVTPLFASLVAERWEEGMGAHFAPFGVALVCVHLLAAAWRGGFGDRRRALRILGGVAAAMCMVAAAYLVLERGEANGTPLLEGFGL